MSAEDMQRLTEALKDMAPSPAILGPMEFMQPFLDALSPEAKALVDNPVRKVEDGHVCFQVAVHWPPKPFYPALFAKTFNDLVARGEVRNVLAVGATALAGGGEVYIDLMGPIDCGPDRYGILYVMMHSDTPLDTLKHSGLPGYFGAEGEISAHFPNYFVMALRQRGK